MILVDTSIWIELLGKNPPVRLLPEQFLKFVTCGPIIQEVVQGLRAGPAADHLRDSFLRMARLSDPLPMAVFIAAADIYQQGRSRAYTIRSSTDCLIAAIAIQNRVPIWHRDRDFDLIARFTPLQILRHV